MCFNHLNLVIMNKLVFFIVICVFASCTQEIESPLPEKDFSVETGLKSATLSVSPYVPHGYNYVWGDEFNDTNLDMSKWSHGLIHASEFQGVWHHVDNYENAVTAEDVEVNNGTLKLLARKNRVTHPNGRVFEHTAGEISSIDSRLFNKCYVEVRCKWPKGKKVWPAIWMTAYGTWPPEWDLWEYFGDLNFIMDDKMQNNLWTGTYPNQENSWHNINNFISTYDANNTYHTYCFEWTKEYATWSIDGVPTRKLNAYSFGNLWPNQDMLFILNHGLRAASQWGNTQLPNAFEVDYVRIYERPSDYNLMAKNSGFELGNSTLWHSYGGTSIYGNGRTGSHRAVCRGWYSGFEYTANNLRSNTTYKFGGWVKTHGGSRSYLAVKNHGANQVTSGVMNANDYQYAEIQFTTGVNNTSATVCWFKYGDPGFAFGDDFRVYEVN